MSCILQNLEINRDSSIAIVAHDSGAANLILGWICEHQYENFKFCISGPALNIFTKWRPFICNTDIDSALSGVSLLISGTSDSAIDLEHQARLSAKRIGVRSVGVIDHWVNYEQRFVRRGKLVLPDEIWVSDEYAESLAHKSFPKYLVRRINNYFLEMQIQSINTKSERKLGLKTTHVLYLLEPIKESWGDESIPAEIQALNFFVRHRGLLGISDNAEIRLRPHPSEATRAFDDWCMQQAELDIRVDYSGSLADLIAWSDVVIGCQTAAMVIALHAKRRVVSVMPPWAPACALPHSGIKMLRDLL
jgi:hypothetical protein